MYYSWQCSQVPYNTKSKWSLLLDFVLLETWVRVRVDEAMDQSHVTR